MYYTVYKITNMLDGKFYIGKHKTKKLDDDYMGSGKLIKRAIKKHGVENFKKEILHVFETEAEMNEAEARLVVLGEDSYNLCPGGEGGFGYLHENGLVDYRAAGRKGGLKQKEKVEKDQSYRDHLSSMMTEINKSRRSDQRSKAFSGKRHSTTSRIKISEKMKALPKERHSQYATRWITNGVMSRKIKVTDTIPDGWQAGRVVKFNAL